MRRSYLLFLLATILWSSCKKDKPGNMPDPPLPVVLLKDVTVPNLPSPYYHFEYNVDGKVSFATFASGFFIYHISYNGDRISEMQNMTAAGRERLQYIYDNAGRVSEIKYVDEADVLFKRSSFSYDGPRLIKIVRERKLGSGMVVEKTSTFSYNPDGNLFELSEHRPSIPFIGQPEITYTDRYVHYDNKVNADAFRLLNPEFFEHMLLLPGIQLQKNNPGKQTRTGDGVNYEIVYTYTYDANDLPLTKTGEGIFLTGSSTGQQFQVNASFSYY